MQASGNGHPARNLLPFTLAVPPDATSKTVVALDQKDVDSTVHHGGKKQAFGFTVAIVSMFTLALLIRMWNLKWGYPFNYHPDEHRIYDNAVEMFRNGTFNPHYFDWPSLLFYLEMGAISVLHAIAHTPLVVLDGPGASPGMIVEAQLGYLTLGRAKVAIMGALTAAFIAASARVPQTRSMFLAAVAGFAAAVVPLHVLHSHYLTPDIPAAFGVAMALFLAIRVADRGVSLKRVLLCGLAVGIAGGVKYTGAVVAVSVAVGILLSGGPLWKRLSSIVLAGLVAVTTFVLTTPYSILDTEAFLGGLGFDFSHYFSGHTGDETNSWLLSVLPKLWNDNVVGPVILGFGLAAILLMGMKRCRVVLGKNVAIASSFVLAYAILYGTTQVPFERTLILLIPGLVLLMVNGVAACQIAIRSRFLRHCFALLVVATLVPTALAGGREAHRLGLTRTQTLSHAWIVENIPPGAHIDREYDGPHLDFRRYVVRAHFTLADMDVSSLYEQSTDYVVLSSNVFRRFTTDVGEDDADENTSGHIRFYTAIFEDRPVAVFCPLQDQVIGPEIWVFALSERARGQHEGLFESGNCRTDWPWLNRE